MADLRNRYLVLGSATTANFGQFGARVAISPFVPAITLAFGQTKGSVGLVLTLLWAASALMNFPSGVAADRFGERRVILIALSVTAVGAALLALSPSFIIFGIAAVVLGAGTGMYFTAGTALLDSRFTGTTGQAFSVHSAGGPLAGLAVPVVASLVAVTYGWRGGVLVGSAVAALAAGFVFLAVGETPASSPESSLRDRLQVGTVVELLGRPPVAFMTAIAVVGMYVFQSFVSFFPTFLQEYHGMTVGEASLATGVVFVLIAVVMPLVGRVGDAYGQDYAIAVPLVVTAGGFAVLLAARSAAGVAAGVGLVGVGLTWGGALQARFMASFGDGERGTAFGLVRSTFVLLGSAGNVATGVLAETAGWPVAFGVVTGLLLLAAILVVGNRALGAGL